MAHIAPTARENLSQFEVTFQRYDQIRGFLPNSILTMAHRPSIAEAFMRLNQAILYDGTVSTELKMLVSLIASQASGCRYCQAHMANLSSVYESSDEKIRAIWSFETSELFDEAERAALRLAHHAGVVPNEASEQDFDDLKKHFLDDEIVEIVAATSLFGYLNRWNDTMATELEAYPAQVAECAIGSTGRNAGKHR